MGKTAGFLEYARAENPYREEDNEKYFLTEESRAASRNLAENCMVLLKNEDGILPLKKAISI